MSERTESLDERVSKLEARVKFLEGAPTMMKALFVKRRESRCHWVKDNSVPQGKFWLPMCYGGIYGKEHCTCQ